MMKYYGMASVCQDEAINIYVCAMHAYMHLTIVNLIFVISFLKMTACPPGTFNEGKGFNCSGTSIYFFACLSVDRMKKFRSKMEQEREIYSATRVIVAT